MRKWKKIIDISWFLPWPYQVFTICSDLYVITVYAVLSLLRTSSQGRKMWELGGDNKFGVPNPTSTTFVDFHLHTEVNAKLKILETKCFKMYSILANKPWLEVF